MNKPVITGGVSVRVDLNELRGFSPAQVLALMLGIGDVVAASNHPKLVRGRVWCTACGATRRVNSAECLRHGWPQCCGQTMTIDSPEERSATQEKT